MSETHVINVDLARVNDDSGRFLRYLPAKVDALAWIRTRLNSFSEAEQSQLINWGYILCDASMRRFVLPQSAAVSQPA